MADEKRKCMELVGFVMAPGRSINGYEFSEEAIRGAVAEAQQRIEDGKFFGALDPRTPKLKTSDISHQIEKLEITDDGRVYATAKSLDTPKGHELEAIAAKGIRLAPEGTVVSRDEQGRVTEMKLTSVSIVRVAE